MNKLSVYLIYFLLISSLQLLNAQSRAYHKNTLSIIFAGDIMGHDAQIEGAYIDSLGEYNYEPTFRYITDYISRADVAVGNLEVSLAGKPYKGYPQFSSPDELAIAAGYAGFDILLTANNHALDRGAKGVDRTIVMLDSLKFIHLGTFLNDTHKYVNYPVIIEKNNIRIALLNYTYGTNGLTVKGPYIINRIDKEQIKEDIIKAKLAEPDFIICTIHWGIEYERDENSDQQELASFIFENGVDVIIGSHPHVVQPIKFLDVTRNDTVIKLPVFYSLGNFVSNQRAQYKDGGIVAELYLSKIENNPQIDSISYLPYWVYREDISDNSTFYVVPVAKYESDTTMLNFSSSDLYRFNRFKNDTRDHLKSTKESGFYK